MLTISSTNDFAALSSLEEDWNRLILNQQFATVYQTWEFQQTWWTVFGQGYDLYTQIARRDKEIVSIMPLVLAYRSGRPVIQFLGSPNFDYQDLIGENTTEIIHAFIEHIASTHKRTSIELSQVSARSQTYRNLQQVLDESGHRFLCRPTEDCPTYEYDGPPNERNNFKCYRGRKFKRATNSFRVAGDIQLKRADSLQEVHKSLYTLFQLHINRWKNTPTPSKFEKEIHRKFYRAMIENMWSSGYICLYTLTAGHLPISCLLSFEFNNTIYHYTPAYNKYYYQRSPGRYHLTWQSETLIRSGYCLDFGRGLQGYKEAMSNRNYVNYEFMIPDGYFGYQLNKLWDAFKKLKPIRKLIRSKTMQHDRSSIANEIRKNGFTGFVVQMITTGTKLILDKRTVDIYSLSPQNLDSLKKQTDIVVSQLTESDIPLLCTFLGVIEQSPKKESLKMRFAHGHYCFMVDIDGFMAAVAWVTNKKCFIEEVDKHLVPSPDEVLLYDLHCSPLLDDLSCCPQTKLVTSLADAISTQLIAKKMLSCCPCNNHQLALLFTSTGFVKQSSLTHTVFFRSNHRK
jgi:CelD/BcsL family acetyltransferase involved in cellulose biosynthesis